MEYSSPELVVIGRADALVLGGPIGAGDNLVSVTSQQFDGLTLGLDE